MQYLNERVKNHSLYDATRRLYHKFRTYRPETDTKGSWETEYATGDWFTKWRGTHELPRYSTIAGYIKTYTAQPTILDIGCGEGILQEHFSQLYDNYVGIDYSCEAIKLASDKENEKTNFVCADAMAYTPKNTFSAIVFNEILYYFDDPAALMQRYESSLAENGIFIVSICEAERFSHVWNIIKKGYQLIDQVFIQHHSDTKWTIKVFRPVRQLAI